MSGTRRLFQFVHDNPIFEMHPTEYVNDPFIISRNERMVAINSAIEIDLTGKTIRQRARALIDIAAPGFRAGLEQQAIALKYL